MEQKCLYVRNLKSLYFKGGKPGKFGIDFVLSNCKIYVPAEYFKDYKAILGVTHKNIYTWNPNY